MNNNKNSNQKVVSSIVSNIVQANAEDEVGAYKTVGTKSKFYNQLKRDKKKKIIFIISALIIVVVIVLLAVFLANKKGKNSEISNTADDTLYDKAYKELKFTEDKNLKKLTCSRDITETKEVTEKDSRIFYFDDSDIKTVIYHTDVNLSDNYMDYYDTMYNEHKKSLDEDYNYPNVDTNIMKDTNRMLITIIIHNDEPGEDKLGVPVYANYDDARKTLVESGYICK